MKYGVYMTQDEGKLFIVDPIVSLITGKFDNIVVVSFENSTGIMGIPYLKRQKIIYIGEFL